MPIEDGGRDAGEDEGESKQDQENCMRRQRQMRRVWGLGRLKGACSSRSRAPMHDRERATTASGTGWWELRGLDDASSESTTTRLGGPV